MTWHELVDAALVGAGRAPLPDLPAALADLTPLDDRDKGELFLTAAAVLSRARRAGLQPSLSAADAPAPALLDGELPLPPEAAQTRMRGLLSNGQRPLIVDWLTVAAGRFRVPDDALPALLELVRQNPQPELLDALGPRGRWLARLNPAWAQLAVREDDVTPDDLQELWATSDLATRETLLQDVLRRARPLARALVDSTWATDKAAARQAWIIQLATDVGPEDEPLLERALDDRSVDVRRAAVRALAGLPQSRWQRAINEQAAQVFTVTKGLLKRTITLTPPAEMPPELLRVGVTAAPPGTGQQAWALQQLVANTDPSVWRDRHGLDAQALVKTVQKSEWSKPFLAGLAAASSRYGDAPTMLALLELDEFAHVLVSALPALPNDTRAQLAAARLHTPLGLSHVFSLDVPWPDAFRRQFLAALPTLLTNPSNAHVMSSVLQRLVLQLPPDTPLPDVDAVLHDRLRSAWRTFTDTLHTRADIRRELTPHDDKESSS